MFCNFIQWQLLFFLLITFLCLGEALVPEALAVLMGSMYSDTCRASMAPGCKKFGRCLGQTKVD